MSPPAPGTSPLLSPLSLAERERLRPGWTLAWAVRLWLAQTPALGGHKPTMLPADPPTYLWTVL